MALYDVLLSSSEKELSKPIRYQDTDVLVPTFVDLRDKGLPYAVAKTPLTNAVFESYVQVTGRAKLQYQDVPIFFEPLKPTVGVLYKDARDYCAWVSGTFKVQCKLPQIEDWEKVASCGRQAPYSTVDGTEKHANLALSLGATSAVDTFPPNPYGLYDMTGNVLEWTDTIPSFEQMRPEYGAMPATNEAELAKNRILKGGCWAFSPPNSQIQSNIIMGLFLSYYTTGFRPFIYFGES